MRRSSITTTSDPTLIRGALLMAAGLGTRLRPFTDLEPKALLPMMGVPMAQFSVDAIVAAGVKKAVANIHHLPLRAREGLLALDHPDSLKIEMSDESGELLGSGGGIRRALPLLGAEPFFLINADVLCDVDLCALARAHARLRERYGVLVTLTIFKRPPLDPGQKQAEKYREILFSPDRQLISGLGEPAEGRPFFTGVAVIEPEALRYAPLSGAFEMVPHVLRPAIEAGLAGAYVTSGQWYDVGSPELWRRTHLSLMRGLETGRIHSAWRRRIETVSRRVAPETWIARSSRATSAWEGPAFWDPYVDSTARPPHDLGPGSVLYGQLPFEPERSTRAGIGFGGVWISAPTSFSPEPSELAVRRI